MIAYLFPGQGSQKRGMGGDLFDEFKDLVEKTDQILGYSIRELCLDDPDKKLGQTQFTQPAIYVVNALTYYRRREETGETPDYVAGHSLGEYNALLAAEVFDYETGLKLVRKRGELMGQASGGGMAAVIGLTDEQIERVLAENDLTRIKIANYNTALQLVVAGPAADIKGAGDLFKSAGARLYVPLDVSGAFHTGHMESAKEAFAGFIDPFYFGKCAVPVISNVHARPYDDSAIKETLIRQITSPVRWSDSVRYLMGRGEIRFEEIGHGQVLTGMVKRIKNEAEPI